MKKRLGVIVSLSFSIMFIGSTLLLFSLQALFHQTIDYVLPIIGGLLLTGLLAFIIIKTTKQKRGE